MKKQHIGSNFDDFLREERLLDVAQATAVKRVIAFQNGTAASRQSQRWQPHEKESGRAGTDC